MALVTHKFKLDLTPGAARQVLYTSQGDIGRPFEADLYWNGSPWTATGTTANIRGKKPDDTVFDYTATVSGTAVTFETTEQMTIISGPVECELVFSQSGDVIASANFVLMVEDSPYNPDAPSESVIPGIVDLIEDTIGGDVRDEVDALIEAHPELMLQDDAVTTPKLAAGAVTEGKIASNAVTTGKLATGAVTYAKLDNSLKAYVTPEMFGAVGDGTTDDTEAVTQALQNDFVYISKTYKTTGTINATAKMLIGNGSIKGACAKFSNRVHISGCRFVPDDTGVELNAGGVILNSVFDGGHIGAFVNDTDKTLPVYIGSSIFKNMSFATGYPAAGVNSESCNRITVDNCKFQHIKTTSADADAVKVWQSADTEAPYCVISNCNFSDIDGRFIKDSGMNTVIENCYGDNTGNTGAITYAYAVDVQKGDCNIENCNFTNVWSVNVARRGTGKQTVSIVNSKLHSYGAATKRPAVQISNFDSNELDFSILGGVLYSDGQYAISANMSGDNVNILVDGVYFATDDKNLFYLTNFTSAGGSLSVYNLKRNTTNTIKYFCSTSAITGAEHIYTDNKEGFFWVASGVTVPINGLKKGVTFYGKLENITTSSSQYMIHAKPVPGTGENYVVEIWNAAEHKVFNKNGVELQ